MNYWQGLRLTILRGIEREGVVYVSGIRASGYGPMFEELMAMSRAGLLRISGVDAELTEKGRAELDRIEGGITNS